MFAVPAVGAIAKDRLDECQTQGPTPDAPKLAEKHDLPPEIGGTRQWSQTLAGFF
jgi:hypothetical protein